MIYLIDHRENNDPHLNLAMEEFCLRNLSYGRSYFIMYVNQPSVIVGRHQNILEEVDLRFATNDRACRLCAVLREEGRFTMISAISIFAFIQRFYPPEPVKHSPNDITHTVGPERKWKSLLSSITKTIFSLRIRKFPAMPSFQTPEADPRSWDASASTAISII